MGSTSREVVPAGLRPSSSIVGQLWPMTTDSASRPPGPLRIKLRRLENTGRKNNIAQRSVVRVIVCGVIDQPLRSTGPQSGDIEAPVRLACPPHIAHRSRRARRIIAWMIRISDFDLIRIKLLERLHLGGRSHPIEPLEANAHGRLQIRNQRLNLGLGCRRKVLRCIQLAHAKAHVAEAIDPITGAIAAAHGADRAFPAHRLDRFSGEGFIAELESCIGEGLRKIERGIVGDAECLPGLEYIQWSRLVDRSDTHEGGFLRNNQTVDLLGSGSS